MNKISKIKVGNTTYMVEGEGGGVLYDAVFKISVSPNNGGPPSISLSLKSGEYSSCMEKLIDEDFLNIAAYMTDTTGAMSGLEMAAFLIMPVSMIVRQQNSIYIMVDNPEAGVVAIEWSPTALRIVDVNFSGAVIIDDDNSEHYDGPPGTVPIAPIAPSV